MEHIYREKQETIIRQSLQQRFNVEREESGNMAYFNNRKNPPAPAAYADDEYSAECSVLPAGLLNGIDASRLLDDNFMLYLTNGFKCSVAILPFADNCSDRAALIAGGRWEKFLTDKDYLRLIVSNSNGFGSRFENDNPGYWYRLLPQILAKDVADGGASFTMKYPHPLTPRGLTTGQIDENRAWLITQIERALNNLRVFFSTHHSQREDAQHN